MQAIRALARGLLVLSLVPTAAAQEVRRTLIQGVEVIEFPFAFVLTNSIWKSTTIPVCWENPSTADAALREETRAAVRETWETHSPIRFVDWGRCTDEQLGIRIRIAEDVTYGPHVKALGNYLDGVPAGMVLNFRFNRWGQSCQQRIVFCVRAIAVHEFGHALGFAHEHNRGDTPPECLNDNKPSGPDGDWKVTEYDPYSIMNYCNKPWLGNGRLSARDIEGLQRIYGKPAQ
jgi:hypothetical protein